MKGNKWLVVLLVLLLFVPSYIAIANYIQVSGSPVSLDKATDLVICDVAGKEYSEKANSEIAALFDKINKNAIKLPTPPDILSGAEYFKVTYAEGKRTTEYRYFFSQNTSAVYYLDPDGVSYLVDEADAAAFLETPYAQSLYDAAYLPVLKNGDNVLLPSSYEWAYNTASGEKALRSTLGEVTEEKVTYKGTSGLEFLFSREPAAFKVTVKSADGELLYDGDYAGLSGAVDTKKHTALVIDATAEWLGTEDMLSSGSAKYSFALNIEAKTEFVLTLSAQNGAADNDYYEFIPGDIAMITGISVADPSKITCTITPALTHGDKEIKPVFYAAGKNVHAFLPTAYDTAAGDYKVVLQYEGISYELDFTVEKKTFKNSVYDIPKATVAATRTAETLATYEKLVAELCGGDFSTAYFDDTTFGTGVSASNTEGYTVKSGYGRYQTISSTDEKFQMEGVEYHLKEGSDIYAVMGGKVLHTTATAYAGTMVAVDHGYGLISWYHNLSEVTVKAGDVVEKGQIIAKSGSTGFTKGGLAYVGLTVFDVPVCAYDFIWGAGILFY